MLGLGLGLVFLGHGDVMIRDAVVIAGGLEGLVVGDDQTDVAIEFTGFPP